MAKHKYLVIVESPTKAKTIQKFLGSQYRVESSFGHIRDLPKSKMGVDVENDFTPTYIVPRANQKRVTALKKSAQASEYVYYATDEDREGEAISWHLQELLNVPEEKTGRIVFHEVTEEAIKEALAHPRTITHSLVDAQQARRILDRLVGYELSPFLWRKIAKGLSAGRVQSVTVRLIVEREREIEAFVAQEYWSIEIDFQHEEHTDSFRAYLYKKEDKVLDKFAISTQEEAELLRDELKNATYSVCDVVKKKVKKSAPPPFITSTLQQESNRRLRFSAKQTMMIAQQLYEGLDTGAGSEGLITYMRTDSVNLSQKFLQEAQEFIASEYGEAYAKGSRVYKTKSKLAQEAHEAIRPTIASKTPESVRQYLSEQQYKLYDLIWRRAVGSQLPDALFDATTIDITASTKSVCIFRATGQHLVFDGFLKIYPIESEESLLPALDEGSAVKAVNFETVQHFTKPPARYSEATIVKTLEEHGIGRPSTYAPTISTIIERNYVTREEGRLKPTEIAFLINDLLVAHFHDIVDYAFTAKMEDTLDEVAEGKKEWVPVLREFYTPFKENLTIKDKELSKASLVNEQTDEVCEKCQKPMIVKMGRFGKFLACSGFPDCKNSKPFETSEEELDAEPCEKCGAAMTLKRGRFGKFLGCTGYPECKNIRSLTDKKLDMPCPTCTVGTVVQKQSKKRRTFYSCSKYPDCDFVAWTKPGEQTETAIPTSK